MLWCSRIEILCRTFIWGDVHPLPLPPSYFYRVKLRFSLPKTARLSRAVQMVNFVADYSSTKVFIESDFYLFSSQLRIVGLIARLAIMGLSEWLQFKNFLVNP